MSESEKVYFSVTIDYSIYRQLVRLAFMSTPFHSSLLTAILVWQHVQKLGACKPSSLVFGQQTDKLVVQIYLAMFHHPSLHCLIKNTRCIHRPISFPNSASTWFTLSSRSVCLPCSISRTKRSPTPDLSAKSTCVSLHWRRISFLTSSMTSFRI